MTMHWNNVHTELWNRLLKHVEDELTYMVVLFDSGYKVQLDYLAHLRYKIVVDVTRHDNGEPYVMESCLMNDNDKAESYTNLNALFEGHHYDDEVEFIKLIFCCDDRDIQYVFDGDQWSKFEYTYEDQLMELKSYYNNGIISKEELKNLAIFDPKNSTITGERK